MTAYVTSSSLSGSTTSTMVTTTLNLGVQAVNYDVRIASATIAASGNNYGSDMTISRYTGGLSGSSNSISPLRDGSPASTAVAKVGGSGSGTQIVLQTGGQLSSGFNPPFDAIISPGHAFYMTVSIYSYNTSFGLSIDIYFEELRLAWHY